MTDKTVLDAAAAKEQLAFAELMPLVAKEYGKSYGSQMKELLTLGVGGNKLLVSEYYDMNLYDDEAYSSEEKKKFVGLQKSRKIWNKVLDINKQIGTINDKLSYEMLMRGFGFAVPRTVGVVGGHYPSSDELDVITDAKALSAFFAKASMPLFGKPIDSLQSLGSARFEAYDPSTGELTLSDQHRLSVVDLFDEIQTKFSGDYLFQECLTPDSDINRICQGGLPTVRIVTLNDENGPQLFRACIKLTATGNVADNFWREGNLLAPVDGETGKMGKAATAMGPKGTYVSKHPTTGETIEGVAVPNWEQTLETAIAAAGLMPTAAMLGFDVAVCENGPVLVEANSDPHLMMLQTSHRKGVLDEQLLSALRWVDDFKKRRDSDIKAYLKAEAAERNATMKEAAAIKAKSA